MQFSYIFGLFVAIGSVAAIPTGDMAAKPAPAALDGTTDDRGRMLRIFQLAAVRKTKDQLQNDRLAPAAKVEEASS
ncbi:hypothetical protein TWF730_005655 [Orbilia blumenaviensis]|uniref:RxLR effector protein n=1 Tax=Orbilia blumenaviensis TaxID=1796055 RepID=A0AAV9VL94_9PEZI